LRVDSVVVLGMLLGFILEESVQIVVVVMFEQTTLFH